MKTVKLSIVKACLSIIWFTHINYVSSTDVDIQCIPVQLCPMAMELIKTRPYDADVIAFLRYSHCGFNGNEAKVWCSVFTRCLTPDSKNGTCKYIKDCQVYVDLLKRSNIADPIVRKYLREYRCTTEFDPVLKVCCPQERIIDKFFSSNDIMRKVSPKSSNILPNYEKEECGIQSSENRIFGGFETNLDEYPWMALLKYAKGNKIENGCGGALINERYVLTAAHCVDDEVTRQKGIGVLFSIVLGEYDIRNETDCFYTISGNYCAEPVQNFKPENIIIHPKFNSTSMANDIALIRLNRKVKYSDFIKSICLPPSDFKLKGDENFTISGWGRTETERQSPVKLKARLGYSRKDRCFNLSKQELKEEQLCIGDGNGIESCYGDSGSPLMLEKFIKTDLIHFAVGLVSFGLGRICGAFPAVYTFIPPYVDWINSVVK